jgi:hypothetical protein
MTAAEILSMPMPAITEEGSRQAHGKLLLTALYERDPLKRGAARRALVLLFDMADYSDG